MRNRRWTEASILLLTLAAFPLRSPSARAQTASPGVEASQQADDFFRKGREQHKSGQLREAYESYRGAWALKQSYDIAANLASVELRLGMNRDAAEHFAFCLRTFAATGSKAQRDAVKKQFEEARKEVGALWIEVTVDGAEVLVDGKSVGRAPLNEEVFVEPGMRTVEAKLGGYKTTKKALSVSKGAAVQTVTLELVAVEPASTSSVDSAAETGPSEKTATRSGRTEHAGTDLSRSTASLLSGVARGSAENKAPTGTNGPDRAVLVAGGAAAGVALAAGVIFTVWSNGMASAAEGQFNALVQTNGPAACAEQGPASGCEALKTAWRDKDAFANAAFWSFVGAGSLGAGTLIYAFSTLKKASPVRARAMPVLNAGGAGLWVHGVW